jgi:uncharacterized protein
MSVSLRRSAPACVTCLPVANRQAESGRQSAEKYAEKPVVAIFEKTSLMTNILNWFEIPASNFERACDFYKKVLGGELHVMNLGSGGKMAMLHGATVENAGGAIVHGKGYEPSMAGSIVYLNAGDDINKYLDRVEKAGGKILVPKLSIGENGFVAHFTDSEGNRVAFHGRG